MARIAHADSKCVRELARHGSSPLSFLSSVCLEMPLLSGAGLHQYRPLRLVTGVWNTSNTPSRALHHIVRDNREPAQPNLSFA